ncbi:MAG: tRNA pseudouridine(55) synthase TruB [Alphaproteobacteria bacterium]|nr:tRNA pseudouridine(55) synthase TruB [Alphaproteobacteria bacterium]
MNNDINGILIINKPEGKSSGYVDLVCKKILGTKKIGHIGTLDPFATGVLPIAINNGTKTIPYIKTESKTYEFEIKFGEKTNTADKTGEIIDTTQNIPNQKDIKNIIPEFIGEIEQKPHIFSAIKINGKRSFELARKGEIPQIASRKVTIFDLKLLDQTSKDIFKFEASVSPGTFIRSLTEDLAESLKSLGYTYSLRRIQDGRFLLKDAITLDELREKRDNINDVLIPLENVLDDIPVISLTCQNVLDLAFGRSIKIDFLKENGKYLASNIETQFLAIVELVDGVIYPKRILQN